MASSYKTPGVYVEEIVKFPPSVAEVETAIPAFVGYTEKAKRFIEDDLHNLPMRIKSLLEFEQYYGTGPEYDDIHVQLTVNSTVDEDATTVSNAVYNLYESMKLFYDNGGGACYICSVGKYSDNDNIATRAVNIKAGLGEVKKFDEPTLLLFPDAVNLRTGDTIDWDKLAGLQQEALKQCGELRDRFAILDVPDEANKTIEEEAEAFRNRVGMNNLKYGAAYAPFLKTIYEKTFRLRDVSMNLYDSGANQIELKSLFSDTDKDANGILIKDKLDDFKKTYTDNIAINSRLSLFAAGDANGNFSSGDLESAFLTHQNTFKGAADDAARKVALKAVFEFVHECFAQLEGLTTAHAAETDSTDNAGPISGKPIRTALITNNTLKTAIESVLGTNLKSTLQSFRNLDNEAYRKAGADISTTNSDKPSIVFTLFTTSTWAPAAAADDDVISGADLSEKGTAAFTQLSKIFKTLVSGINTVVSSGVSFEKALEDALTPDIPIYTSINKALNNVVNTLPPSGAVAGVYATVDRERGVWKAPANVSLNAVSGVSEYIDDATQEGLNVDSNVGKSINAIRPFYGKGVLVWGARTLAGNDNEWRYVPVRRFFNFVEESCKKSTSWAVFEPNDANTWLRIKAQIENFLNNLWRRGALAGAKPEHAYIVNCGLGITMTAQDILNGYLNVEIAMAAVRPAEFVVLKFSHKLQQS
jgi:uncharacterized protein